MADRHDYVALEWVKGEIAELILEQVALRHEETEWFQAYQELTSLAEAELSAEHAENPVDRLIIHLANTECSLEEACVLLTQLSGRPFNEQEARTRTRELAAEPSTFGSGGDTEAQLKKLKRFT
ncbi:MAG: hypothetical protein EOO81_12280 [Oxalobacteraceae bacterium]|nr:MAG: hypothetical protein EOO81_12280 [Oxalobacteraceae bacterium]